MVQPPQDLHLCMSVCACHWIALLKTACSTLPVCHPSYKPRTLVKVRDPKAPLAHLPGSILFLFYLDKMQTSPCHAALQSSQAFATASQLSSEGNRVRFLPNPITIQNCTVHHERQQIQAGAADEASALADCGFGRHAEAD